MDRKGEGEHENVLGKMGCRYVVLGSSVRC